MHAETLKLVLSLADVRPAPGLPRRLEGLFARLADPACPDAAMIEDTIWALWIDHRDPAAADAMNRAIAALARRQFEVAETMFDALIARDPGYAEAWNKRATLHFLLRQDAESVRDVHRTLTLEPRHFGALCGFGQICLRGGDPAGALVAFETALAINPHLAGIRQVAAEIAARFAGRHH